MAKTNIKLSDIKQKKKPITKIKPDVIQEIKVIKPEIKKSFGVGLLDARKSEIQPKISDIIKKETKEEDEELEEEFFENETGFSNSAPTSFNYPFLRRAAPSIRIQPIATNLEIDLEEIPTPTKTEEDNIDQYKPTPEKNYALNQKYELPGGASYDSITPKEIKAPPSPSLTPNFGDQMNAARGFGNVNPSTPGYPGQESSDRKYDSGLEQQTQSQQDRRRRDM